MAMPGLSACGNPQAGIKRRFGRRPPGALAPFDGPKSALACLPDQQQAVPRKILPSKRVGEPFMNEAKEKYKIIVMVVLLAGACFLTYYFHVVAGRGTVFTHLFYVPIILAARWWKIKGVAVPLFLALLLIFSHFLVRADVETVNDLIRAPMFILVGLTAIVLTERIAKAEKKAAHLNAVLGAIQNVNRVIARENDRDRLFEGVCYALIETRGYYTAWIALIDGSGKLVTFAEAGLGADFLPLVERLKAGELTPCVQKALKQPDVVVTEDPSSACADCPLAKSCAGMGAMTLRLEHHGKIYGLLSASIPAEFAADEEEQALFKELAANVAFAVHEMELEEKRKSSEEELARQAQELCNEREKLKVILQSTADGILVTDPQSRILMANPSAEHLLGFSFKEVVGKKLDVTIREKTLTEKIYKTRQEARIGYEFELELKDPTSSEPRVLSGKTACLKDREGEVMGVVTALSDITRLREVDRMKTEFLSTAAHQIRTPLTSIQGFSEILLTREIGKEETRKFLTYINKQAVELAAIINELLDISRIESEKGFKVEKHPCSIQSIIEENVRIFEETSKIHRFHIDLESDIPDISMDRDKISQAIKNLLSNATKYSPEGGEIWISARRRDQKTIEISISDQGIGMTDQQLYHVFEKFYRAGASDKAVEGTGLGLSIVKGIVEAHGGKIWMESRYGVGTTAHFTLPVNTNVR